MYTFIHVCILKQSQQLSELPLYGLFPVWCEYSVSAL